MVHKGTIPSLFGRSPFKALQTHMREAVKCARDVQPLIEALSNGDQAEVNRIKDRIFEARFTTRSGRVEFGLGLGLPIARSIIRQHGGDISFDSEPGRTVFIVDLPETPPAIPATANLSQT